MILFLNLIIISVDIRPKSYASGSKLIPIGIGLSKFVHIVTQIRGLFVEALIKNFLLVTFGIPT